MDGTSRCGRLSSPTFVSRKKLTASTRMASGIIAQNIMRQPHASMMPPASIQPRPVMKCLLADESTTSRMPEKSISQPKTSDMPR